jgi:predicted homoserine dehydrogenase-like protein
VAKRDLRPGEQIPYGIGSFDARGVCVRIEEHAGHLPIGLLRDASIRRKVERGQILTFDDVELPDSLALTAWLESERRALEARTARVAT